MWMWLITQYNIQLGPERVASLQSAHYLPAACVCIVQWSAPALHTIRPWVGAAPPVLIGK